MTHRLWSTTVPVMQNRVFASRAEALRCAVAPLELVWDANTGLVYNACFDADLLTYDERYNNEQSFSAVFQHHLHEVADLVTRKVPQEARVVEVGCGKAAFLRLLRQRGFPATGCDPAYEGDEPYITKEPFGRGTALRADLVILRHVLEHIPHPYTFLKDIADANGRQGLIYIEVPDLDWIIRHRAYYDLMYEHCNYFCASSLRACFQSNAEVGTLFGGQYLWLTGDLADMAAEPVAASRPPDFTPLQHGLIALASEIRLARRRFVWGAGAKGTTLAYLLHGTDAEIDYLIDVNPAKQGHFSPASGTPIISPDEARARLRPSDLVLIMNPNYQREIETSLPSGVSCRCATDDLPAVRSRYSATMQEHAYEPTTR
jgi:SAM-dependent methyltransferase